MKKRIISKENETLFLPLYRKAKNSRMNGIFTDKKPGYIAAEAGYDFRKIK